MYDDKLRQEALEDAVSALEDHWTHVRTLRHEDGSVTVISVEEYVEPWMSPREADGNVAHLVMQHRDYVELDQGDAGIEEARERWDGGWGYGETYCDQTAMVGRYLAIFRPDIAHYEPRWEVSGSSQSDWAYGYGYVLWSDLAKAGLTPTYMAAHSMTPASLFEEEVAAYGAYFAGEVYLATHLVVGEPVVSYGDHGAYVNGYRVDEDSCGGFLHAGSYNELADHLAHYFTSSPVAS